MAGFLSIHPNLALVKVWNQHSVALLLMQVLCLPLDLVCHAPPFLASKTCQLTGRAQRMLGASRHAHIEAEKRDAPNLPEGRSQLRSC